MDVDSTGNGTDNSIVDDNDNLSASTNATDKEQHKNNITKTNTSVNVNKLLAHKGEPRTNKKQSPLEEALARYEKQLNNKSLEELEKEKKKLEFDNKTTLILSIIAIIAFVALAIAAFVLLPISALAIGIISALGAILTAIMEICDYKRLKKMIDIVNAKIAQKKLYITPRGNKKNQYIDNGQSNNKSISGQNINQNKNNNNITQLKDTNEKNNININNNQNLKKKNTSKIDKTIISNNILANKKNSIRTNTSEISKNIAKQVDAGMQKKPKSLSVNNNKQSDKQKAEEINSDTLNRILNGTLDLSSNRPKNKQEYEQCKKELKQAKTQETRAMLQQKVIKYEIWNQLSPDDQQAYEQLTKKGKSPEEIKDNAKNNANWQVNLYNKHLENEEKKNQSLLSTINPVNWDIFKNKKTFEEKQQAVKTAILGQQQKNGIKLSSVGQQTGDNYKSGAITDTNITKQQVKYK